MPLYEYLCPKCGNRFEKIEGVSLSGRRKCPKCGARADRVMAPSALQFKGSGWYATDYAGKASGDDGKKAEQGTETGKEASKETSKETRKETSKPEPAKESAPQKKKEKE